MRYYLRCSLIPTPKGHKSYTKSLQHDQCNSPNVCNSQNKQTHATIKQTTQLKLLENTAMYTAGKYLCKCLWPLTDHSPITHQSLKRTQERTQERTSERTPGENTRIDIRENASDNNRENTRGNTWGHIRLRWLGRFWGLADSIESILWMWRAGVKFCPKGRWWQLQIWPQIPLVAHHPSDSGTRGQFRGRLLIFSARCISVLGIRYQVQ